MAFISFVGRVLFVSAFLLSAWQEYNEFGVDGGLAAKTLKPKFNAFSQHFSAKSGFQLPEFEIKYIVAATIALKGLGSVLFILGSSFGAFLLIVHQVIVTPILYDFYNYDSDKKQFTQLFGRFTQNMQLLGALLFFIALNRSVVRRQVRKKNTKTKTIEGEGGAKWRAPPHGWIKVNSHASVFEKKGTGIGFCVRDEEGNLLKAGTEQFNVVLDPLVAEAKALIRGLQLAVGFEQGKIIMESDCLDFIHALRGNSSSRPSVIDVFLDDIMLVNEFHDEIRWSCVHRSANSVARELARCDPWVLGVRVWDSFVPSSVRNLVLQE